MPLTEKEARALGKARLRVDDRMFNFAANVAKDAGIRPADMWPMVLAIAVLKLSKAEKSAMLGGELTDALQLVSKAEVDWRLEQRGFRKQ